MQFISSRHRWYIFSAILSALALLIFLFFPRNLGIDMTGGIQMTYVSDQTITSELIHSVEAHIDGFGQAGELLDKIVYPIESSTSFRVEVGLDTKLTVEDMDIISESLRSHVSEYLNALPYEVHESSYVQIGNSLGSYIRKTAIFTVIVSLILIAAYLTYSFRGSLSGWSNLTFGAITLITLFHDILIATGMYIFLGLFFPFLEIDTFFVTAILTILGYSINDTIVVLDRIRSGLTHAKQSDGSLKELFENSIRATVRRSIFTSVTLLLVLITLLIVGPTQLVGFVVLLMLGTVVGTYSSIFIAAPLVYDIERLFGKARKKPS